MKRLSKLFIYFSLCMLFLFTFTGCDEDEIQNYVNMMNTVQNGDVTTTVSPDENISTPTIEPTPEPFVDENLLVGKDGFYLYHDGTHNYKQDMELYEQTDVVPAEYYKYATLLNHTTDYVSTSNEQIVTPNLTMNVIAELGYAKEVRFNYCGYEFHTIIPNSLTSEDCFYVKPYDGGDSKKHFAIFDNEESTMFISVQSYDNEATRDSFIQEFVNLDKTNLEKMTLLFPEVILLGNFISQKEDENYVFVSEFALYSYDYYEDNEYTTGVANFIFDKNNGTCIVIFTGYKTFVNDEYYDYWGFSAPVDMWNQTKPLENTLNECTFTDGLCRWNVVAETRKILEVNKIQ